MLKSNQKGIAAEKTVVVRIKKGCVTSWWEPRLEPGFISSMNVCEWLHS